jgi:hypothetical protein
MARCAVHGEEIERGYWLLAVLPAARAGEQAPPHCRG